MVILYESEYLAHHGVKGQKWGVRRWQNGDGSLTSAGRIHYGYGKGREKSGANQITTYGAKGGLAKRLEKSLQERSNVTVTKDGRVMTKDVSKNLQDGLNVKTVAETGRLVAQAMSLNPVAIGALALKGAGQISASIKTKKVEKNNAAGELDKKTGFHKKDREYSTKEDVQSVNPKFRNFTDGSKNNCMLCSMTYDLRARGFAVSANKSTTGFMADDISRWYPKSRPVKIDDKNEKGKYSKKVQVENTIKAVEKQGPGARGVLTVSWDMGGGHALAYEVGPSGKMQILECQAGKIYDKPEKLLKRVHGVSYTRLDNVDFNADLIKEVAH